MQQRTEVNIGYSLKFSSANYVSRNQDPGKFAPIIAFGADNYK